MPEAETSCDPPVFQPDEPMQAMLRRQQEMPLAVDLFDGRENEVFTIVDGEAEVPMTLVKVERLKKYEGAPCQNPGSLLFRVAGKWSIPQRMYVVRADWCEDIVLFLTQVASPSGDAEHIYLETVFN